MTHLSLRTLTLVILPLGTLTRCFWGRRLGCGRENPVQPTLLFCVQRLGKLLGAFTDAFFTNSSRQYDCMSMSPRTIE